MSSYRLIVLGARDAVIYEISKENCASRALARTRHGFADWS
jgi:hypothetical protein